MNYDDRTVPTLEGLRHDVYALSQQISSLTETVESRLYDTRPLWESVDNRLGAVENRIGAVESRLESVESKLDSVDNRLEAVENRVESLDAHLTELRTDIRRLDHKIGLQNRTIGDIYADQRELEEKIAKKR